jgi:hypothetical protein
MTRKKRPKELQIRLKKLQKTGDASDELKKSTAKIASEIEHLVSRPVQVIFFI